MGFDFIIGAIASSVLSSAPGFLVNFAISQVASAFFASAFGNDTKRTPDGPVIDTSGRQQMVRSAVANRRVIYGEVRVSGPIVYASTTNVFNSVNGTLNLVIVLAGHECESIGDVYFNDDRITPDMLASNGVVNVGKYAPGGNNLAQIRKHLGEPGQQADSVLMAETPDWTTSHTGDGVTYIYCRLQWDRDVYATGIPNISAIVRGKKLYDPRTGLTTWSTNWALAMRDYLTDPDYGLGCDATEIDEASFIAAANICDERVDGPDYANTFTATASTDTLTLGTNEATFDTGDGVRLTSTGTLPAGLSLATTYYYIRTGNATCKLASSLANAWAGTAIDVTDAGSGVHTMSFYDQARYTINGTIDTGSRPLDVIKQMVSAGGGRIVYTQGTWKIFAGAYRASSGTLTVSDLAGDIDVIPRTERKELYNGVRGTFVSPYNAWQEADFPVVKSETYKNQDGGVEILRDIALPFTTNPIAAQRLAKLMLEKGRQAITVTFPAKYTVFKYDVADTVAVTISQLGWSAKEFTIENWKYTPGGTIDLVLQEESSAAYTWAAADASAIDAAPDTDLPNPTTVVAPGAPVITETLYETTGSAGLKVRATMSWTASEDAFVEGYEPQYKLASDSTWSQLPTQIGTSVNIEDIAPDTYDFRVRAINSLGVRSDYSGTTTREILGLTANPSDATNFTVIKSAGFALASWDLCADLDVRQGGRAVVRHSTLTTGATWLDGMIVGEFAGNAVNGFVPLVTGTYMLKFVDSTGNWSANMVSFVATEGLVTGYSTLATITESTGFSGTKTNTAVVSSTLRLDTSVTIDTMAGNVDDWPAIDSLSGVALSGSYEFASKYDGTTVATRRFEADITVASFDTGDLVDSRGAVDDWDSVDGTVINDTDATLYIATTNDDPASGGATWSSWAPFVVAEFTCRGAKFRLDLETASQNHNIAVSLLAVAVKA